MVYVPKYVYELSYDSIIFGKSSIWNARDIDNGGHEQSSLAWKSQWYYQKLIMAMMMLFNYLIII